MLIKTFHQSAFWATLSGFAIRGIGLFTGVLVARILGPLERGQLAAIMVFISIGALVSILGIDQAVGLKVAKGNHNKWLSSGLFLMAIVGTILTLSLQDPKVAYWILPAEKDFLGPGLAVAAISMPPLLLGYVFASADQGKFKFKRRGLLMAIQPLIYALALIVLWGFRRVEVMDLVLAYVIASWLGLAIKIWVFKTNLEKPELRKVNSLARLGFNLHLPHISFLCMGKIDLLLAVSILTDLEMGLYVVAIALAAGQGALMDGIGRAVSAQIAASRSGQEKAQILSMASRISQVLAAALIVVLVPMAPILIKALFGFAYADASKPAQILCASGAFLGLASVIDMGLRASGDRTGGTVAFVIGLTTIYGFALRWAETPTQLAWSVLAGTALTVISMLAFLKKSLGNFDKIGPQCGLNSTGVKETYAFFKIALSPK